MPTDTPDTVEASGKTVDDAVLQALRRLGLSRGQVDVSVITEGRPGVFGIGATEARVRVSAIGAGGRARDDAPPRRDEARDDTRPLPKIDDYADYAEVDARPRPDRGRGRPPAQRDGGRSGGRGEGRGRSPARPAERDRAADSRESAGRSQDAGRGRGPRPEGSGGRGGRGHFGGGRGSDRDPIMQREPLPFDLLADPDYEPDDDQDPTQLALAVLTDLLHLMRVDADVASREPETPMDGLNHAVAVLDVTATRDGGALDGLIGRHGEHLAALQYIVNLIVNRALEGRHAFTVDIDGHKRRREQEIEALAKDAADDVRETHETVELEAMPAAERRIIHITLADDPDVATESAGAGHARRVQIVYRDD